MHPTGSDKGFVMLVPPGCAAGACLEMIFVKALFPSAVSLRKNAHEVHLLSYNLEGDEEIDLTGDVWVRPEDKPFIIILDGDQQQVRMILTPRIREMASELNIHFGKLPSRFSFLSQPNDKMASFRVIKKETRKWSWKNCTDPAPGYFAYLSHKLQARFPNAARRGLYLHFFKHVSRLLSKAYTHQIVCSGWRDCGYYPPSPLKMLASFRWWRDVDRDLREIVCIGLPKLRQHFKVQGYFLEEQFEAAGFPALDWRNHPLLGMAVGTGSRSWQVGNVDQQPEFQGRFMHLNSAGVLANYDSRNAERAAREAAVEAARVAREATAAATAAARQNAGPKRLHSRTKCTMRLSGMCTGPEKYSKPVGGAAESWTACARGHHFFCPVCTPQYGAAHNC
jgi:hypothetical protein